MRAYVYVFVRQDISPEQQLVQSGHALIEAQKLWEVQEHPNLVAIGVKTLFHLEKLITKLQELKIRCGKFTEPDLGDTMTAVATEPLLQNDPRRQEFKRYQLLQFSSREPLPKIKEA